MHSSGEIFHHRCLYEWVPRHLRFQCTNRVRPRFKSLNHDQAIVGTHRSAYIVAIRASIINLQHCKTVWTTDWMIFQMTYAGPEGYQFYVTTEVNIIPDIFPYEDCHGTEMCRGVLLWFTNWLIHRRIDDSKSSFSLTCCQHHFHLNSAWESRAKQPISFECFHFKSTFIGIQTEKYWQKDTQTLQPDRTIQIQLHITAHTNQNAIQHGHH